MFACSGDESENVLSAETPEEMEEWVAAIKGVLVSFIFLVVRTEKFSNTYVTGGP